MFLEIEDLLVPVVPPVLFKELLVYRTFQMKFYSSSLKVSTAISSSRKLSFWPFHQELFCEFPPINRFAVLPSSKEARSMFLEDKQ